MRISRAVLREVPMELREFFEISSGGMQQRRMLLLTLEADGIEAWAECVAGETPGYSYETSDTAWQILTDMLLPAVVGQELNDARDILGPSVCGNLQ